MRSGHAMKELKVKAIVASLPEVTAFIDAQLEEIACPVRAQMHIDLAIDELFANIANYAYAPGTGDAVVGYEYDEKERTVSVTFTDSGVPFDPLQNPDPDISLPAEERQIGGLGIMMVKKVMDDIVYRYENGKNILTIRKKL